MIYKTIKQFPVLTLLFVVALIASVRADGPKAPVVPSEIAVPEGNPLFIEALADGVQIYTCKAKDDGAGYEWSFSAPEATLRDESGAVLGKHYAGPSWEANDGSRVEGKVQAKVASSDTAAIPWLLLATEGVGTDGIFAKTTFIQRLETVAGVAPTDGCDEASMGTEARVPYTATYYFYQAE
jgi:hypothetical protein